MSIVVAVTMAFIVVAIVTRRRMLLKEEQLINTNYSNYCTLTSIYMITAIVSMTTVG